MFTNEPYFYRRVHKRHRGNGVFFAIALTIALSIACTGVAVAIEGTPGTGGNSTSVNTNTTPTQPVNPGGGTGGNSSSVNTNTTPTTNTDNTSGTGGGLNTDTGEVDYDKLKEETEKSVKEMQEAEKKKDYDDSGLKTGHLTEDDIIVKTNPIIDVTHIGNSPFAFKKGVFDFFRGITDKVSGLTGVFLEVMDKASDPLFTANFTTGAFERLYRVANQVAHTVGIPFGTAICGISFMIGMVEVSERHRRYESRIGALDTVLLVFSLALSLFLINHAVDICALVYQLSANAVGFLKEALQRQGIGTTTLTISDSIVNSMTGVYDTITYKEFGMSALYCLLALATMLACGGVMIYVILQGLLRMGELYLRAAFSPIVIGFGASKQTRPMAIQYLKRFAAVALNAAFIVLALALSGLLFRVATDVIAPAISSNADGLLKTVGTLIPVFVAISAVKELVQRSQQASLSIFGLQ